MGCVGRRESAQDLRHTEPRNPPPTSWLTSPVHRIYSQITAWTYLMSLLWVPRQLRIERERRGDTMVDNKNSTSSGIIGRRLDSVDQERGGVPAPMHNGPGPLKSSRVPERGVNATNEPTYVDDSSTFAPSNNHSFDASRRTSTAPLVEGR